MYYEQQHSLGKSSLPRCCLMSATAPSSSYHKFRTTIRSHDTNWHLAKAWVELVTVCVSFVVWRHQLGGITMPLHNVWVSLCGRECYLYYLIRFAPNNIWTSPAVCPHLGSAVAFAGDVLPAVELWLLSKNWSWRWQLCGLSHQCSRVECAEFPGHTCLNVSIFINV